MKYRIAVAALGLILGASVCRGEELTFETVQPVARGKVMDVQGLSRQALRQALTVHNLMFSIRNLERESDSVSKNMTMRQIHEAQRDATENCSINKMAGQFKDPQAVWDKMKTEYNRRIKDLTIYFNSAEPATKAERQAFEEQMAKGEMSPEAVSEAFASWQIGRDILMDVYQNQDQWGDRPDSDKSTTFPLWEDQKYQFDREWDSFYTNLNLMFGVPPEGRPIIGDEKYDYAQADKVEKAHLTYLALLTAKNPVQGAALAASFRKPPVAPRPLPPKYEIMFYLESDTPEARIYPEMPEPWQKYAENGFVDVAPTGEMAADFSNGLTLKESALRQPHNNRLEAYRVQKETADSSARLESLAIEQADRRLSSVKLQLSRLLDMDMFDVNLMDPDTRETVLKLLGDMKQKYLALAEGEVKAQEEEGVRENRLTVKWEELDDFAELKAVNPVAFKTLTQQVPLTGAEQDQNLLKALKADPEGRVYLNGANAGEIDKMAKEERARTAFLKENHDLEDMLAATASQKMDDTCINGGI